MSANSHADHPRDAVRGGPSQALCPEPLPPTLTPPRAVLDAPPPRRLSLDPPRGGPSRWWNVFGALVLGIAGLLGIHAAQRYEEPAPVAAVAEPEEIPVSAEWLSPWWPADLAEQHALAREVDRLRERLARVEERQKRMLEIPD